VADLTEQQREQNQTRRWRKAQRAAGRDMARDHAFEALNQLLADGAAPWFRPEQASSYMAELRRLRDRIGESSFARYCRQSESALSRARGHA